MNRDRIGLKWFPSFVKTCENSTVPVPIWSVPAVAEKPINSIIKPKLSKLATCIYTGCYGFHDDVNDE